jgi:trehalose 6-phosphate phosphatase
MTNWQDALADEFQTLIEQPRLGIICDVDGTLSPIVDSPEKAQITPRNRQLLEALLGQLDLVAVVSGRAAEDVRQRVAVPGVVYVGNHGMERWQDGGVVLPEEVKRHRPALEAALRGLQEQVLPGMLIEDKTATLSVHFRNVDNPAAAAQMLEPLLAALSQEHGLRIFQGRMVFEVRPPVDTNKGSAVRSLVSEFALDGAVYIGDDTTDVDAFRAARQLREEGACYALALGVDSEETPESVREASDFLVWGVSEVESFLSWLFKARSASAS